MIVPFPKLWKTPVAICILLQTLSCSSVEKSSITKEPESSIIAETASLVLISDQFSFTEGPASDNDGNVYFTDQPNNRIWLIDTAGQLSVYLEKSGRSNGLYFNNNGNLIACADENNELWEIDDKKKITVLLNSFNGTRFNGPNDVWVSPKGGIYFTDPYYKRPYWPEERAHIKEQNVYYMRTTTSKPIVVADQFIKPNGIIGSLDSRYLYVADIGGNKTFRYTMNKDGSLKDKQLFANIGSDGMTTDNLGNVYLTGREGVTVFNKSGKQIKLIGVPQSWTANVCFGGKNHNKLFITASKAIYSLEMKVSGIK